MKGRLFLLPATLGGDRPEDVIPPAVFGYVAHVRHFAVEELRSARRFLSSVGFRGMMDSLEFYPVNEHSSREDIEKEGISIGRRPCVFLLQARNVQTERYDR